MSRIRLYLDEDAMKERLLKALRANGIDTLTTSDAGMVQASDEENLRYAVRDPIPA